MLRFTQQITTAFGFFASSFALKASRCASDSGVHGSDLYSFALCRRGQPSIGTSNVAASTCSSLERPRISSDSSPPTNAGTAQRPQKARARSRRDFILPSSAGNASSWGAFPRCMLPASLRSVSPESSPSSLGSEERRQQARSSTWSSFSDEILAEIALIRA